VHPLRHPRNAIFVGALFSFIGFVYWFVQYNANFHADIAGVTLLLLLGVAVSIMAYVLIAGSPND
jgi:ABC-type Fe3+-siderophore transport system permease subunit